MSVLEHRELHVPRHVSIQACLRYMPASPIYSDDSGTYGCGAAVDSLEYFQLEWPRGWEERYLPARASEQGNVIGLVSVCVVVYVLVIKKKL